MGETAVSIDRVLAIDDEDRVLAFVSRALRHEGLDVTTASTGEDGKQYFVPLYNYPWAVHYRKSVFEANGFSV